MVELTNRRLDVGAIAKFNGLMHHDLMSKRIAVIGGGFCGTVLAANLLRRTLHDVDEILLVERGPLIGRGVAYAAYDFPYLLNVPAGRLSADTRAPLDFLDFARQTLPETQAEDFLPRRLYGDYLEDFLAAAERAASGRIGASGRIKLVRIQAEVTRLSAPTDRPGPLTLHCADHPPITAQRVVLALGNPPPRALPGADRLHDHPAFFNDPWRPPKILRAEQTALIVGNGLTMADVVSFLSRNAAETPRLVSLSRRGLTPLPQSAFHSKALRGGAEFFADLRTIRQVVSAGRSLADEVMRLGGDWREVVTFIRHGAPMLWRSFAQSERRRFLRHVQGVWDVHRHRLPVATAAHLDELRRKGQLRVVAGRILALDPVGARVAVTWRPRGAVDTETLTVDAVINATGPDYALEQCRNGLLQALRGDGWIAADDANLGLLTTAAGACVGADGRSSDRLFYLGPMLRAGHWEATAVAELRAHAEALADTLAEAGG